MIEQLLELRRCQSPFAHLEVRQPQWAERGIARSGCAVFAPSHAPANNKWWSGSPRQFLWPCKSVGSSIPFGSSRKKVSPWRPPAFPFARGERLFMRIHFSMGTPRTEWLVLPCFPAGDLRALKLDLAVIR